MANSTPRAMTPQDITRIQWLSDPQVSPDGTRVAFVRTTLSEDKDEYLSNVWLVDVAGGEPRRFTSGPKRDTAPRWSPDGTRIAFVSEREAKKRPQLYVMPADGGEPVRLTDLKNGAGAPVWSPDGTRLAFVSRVGGWQEPESEEEKAKSKPARVITVMKYKFNGEGFTYDRLPHVFVVAADGSSEPVQITDGDFADGDPTWTPDGQGIVFASARHDNRDYDNVADLWYVPVSGGEPRRITDTAGPLSNPTVSPDGRTVAYFGSRHVNDVRHTRLFTVPFAGGTPACLTASLDRTCQPFFGSVSAPWSADGRFLTFLSEDQGAIIMHRVAADGSGAPQPIASGPRQIPSFSASKDGSMIAFAATDPVSPAEIFVCNADGTGERQLTNVNQAWKAEVALSRPERFRYERAGFTVDGWVMKPYGYEPGKTYPTLLDVHGGPATQYGHTFFDEFQVYAGAGYAVIFTNPRGSQGYSEDFVRAVMGDWGGGDYADVMMGVDEAIARFDFIDPERLGVMGGSYGGYMTSWTVGHTNRFKAAVSERAVNSMVTLFGVSDIGHSFPETQSNGALPWTDMQWYLDHSPLTYARHIETPLLIIHSDDDLRCPMEQADQLFITLKKMRKEVLFIRFPDENHEMSRSGRVRHRLARFGFILDWFQKYLKPEAAEVRTQQEAVAAS